MKASGDEDILKEARGALLDALEALREHRESLSASPELGLAPKAYRLT